MNSGVILLFCYVLDLTTCTINIIRQHLNDFKFVHSFSLMISFLLQGFFFNMTLYTGDAMVYVLQTTSIKIAFVVKHNIMFTDSLQYSLHIKIRHR